jgi:hypothetical protein
MLGLRCGSHLIGIFDSEYEFTAVLTRETPVE